MKLWLAIIGIIGMALGFFVNMQPPSMSLWIMIVGFVLLAAGLAIPSN